MSIGSELLNTPFPEMIKSMGVSIAEAQYELDLVSMKIARMMAGYGDALDSDGAPVSDSDPNLMVNFGDGGQYSLLELGFTPTFYQFVDTLIEIKVSISMTRESSTAGRSSSTDIALSGKLGFLSASTSMRVASVNASYASKYQYSAEGSSLMRTKLVPVPAPALLEERIRTLLNLRAAANTPIVTPS